MSTPFERSEIHFSDAIHYSEFAEDGELSLKEGPGIISTRWEDLIKEDAEKSSERVSNLMKRDEAEPSERAQKKLKTDGEEQCIKVTLPDGNTFFLQLIAITERGLSGEGTKDEKRQAIKPKGEKREENDRP